MKLYKIKVKEGEPLVESLEKKLKKEGIKEGFIVSIAGALTAFSLVTIYKDSPKIPPEHFKTEFKENAEITGNGFIEDGKVHIHLCCGIQGGKTLCGHLVEGRVTYFAHIGVLTK